MVIVDVSTPTYTGTGPLVVVVVSTGYVTGGDLDYARFRQAQRLSDLNREVLEFRKLTARVLERPTFFPVAALAPLPPARPISAPPARPTPRTMHFASPRVWARRNKPMPKQPPRRET